MVKFITTILIAFGATLALAKGLHVWSMEYLVLDRGAPGSFDSTAVKDPSIVQFESRWYLFYTARGNQKYSIGYVSAPDLRKIKAAPRFQLSQLNDGSGMYVAPEVFYFQPLRKWFLIYQTSRSNYQPAFSSTSTIDRPASWSRPETLVNKSDRAKWIDFWVICDNRLAYLFYTRNHKDVTVMTTPLKDFPHGFSHPQVVFSGVHEAVHIYREAGMQEKYALLFESRNASGWRDYGLAEAPRLLGPWTTTNRHFASRIDNGWSRDVSHGELLRTGYDQLLEADVAHAQFLIQGMPPQDHTGNYPSLPWRLILIRR